MKTKLTSMKPPLTPEHQVILGNHLARAGQTSLRYAKHYAEEGNNTLGDLWCEAAQKLLNPERWMAACAGFKLWGIGDGGRSFQPSAVGMSIQDALAVIFGDSDDVDSFSNREFLVDTCIRLAVGCTPTEEEWLKSIQQEDIKNIDNEELPNIALGDVHAMTAEYISIRDGVSPELAENISQSDTFTYEWVKALQEDEVALMYALQTAIIIIGTYEEFSSNRETTPETIFSRVNKACKQIPDAIEAFFAIARGRHQGIADMQSAHTASQNVFDEIVDQTRRDEIPVYSASLEDLWNVSLSKAEEKADTVTLHDTSKEKWSKYVGMKVWGDFVFLKSLATPGTHFLFEWYLKQRESMSTPSNSIPSWMFPVVIKSVEDGSWRSVLLQPPPIIQGVAEIQSFVDDEEK